jgi:uncharacterized membrane protein YoaT (DUF817 family)
MRREEAVSVSFLFFVGVLVGFLIYFASTGWIWGLDFFPRAREMFSLVHVGLVRSWVRCMSSAGSIRLTIFSLKCCDSLNCC